MDEFPKQTVIGSVDTTLRAGGGAPVWVAFRSGEGGEESSLLSSEREEEESSLPSGGGSSLLSEEGGRAVELRWYGEENWLSWDEEEGGEEDEEGEGEEEEEEEEEEETRWLLREDVPEPSFERKFANALQTSSRKAILAVVGALAETRRFKGRFTSLLDVGCGKAELVRHFSLCSDRLPFTAVTGIGANAELAEIKNWGFIKEHRNTHRWRPLDLYMLLGSFECLNNSVVGYHDVVISSEVIEHLGSGQLEQFAPHVLGRLKPKVWIVTTPKRDSMPYPARHPAHRTRAEFRTWAQDAAGRSDYHVEFCSVGRRQGGCDIEGLEGLEGLVDETDARKLLEDPVYRNSAGADTSKDAFHRTLGDFSQTAVFVQMAVFVLRRDAEQAVADAVAKEDAFGRPEHREPGPDRDYDEIADGIKLVAAIHIPRLSEPFPPSLHMVLHKLLNDHLITAIPELILDEWAKSDVEYFADLRAASGVHKPPPIGGVMWLDKPVPDFAYRVQKLTGRKLSGIHAIQTDVDMSVLFHRVGGPSLKRVCHGDPANFWNVLCGIKAEGRTPKTIIDTTDAKGGVKMTVDVHTAPCGATLATAKLPVQPRLVDDRPLARPDVQSSFDAIIQWAVPPPDNWPATSLPDYPTNVLLLSLGGSRSPRCPVRIRISGPKRERLATGGVSEETK